MKNFLIKGSTGTGKTIISRAFAYNYCHKNLSVEASFEQAELGNSADIETFIQSNRCEYIQIHPAMGYEDIVYGLQISTHHGLSIDYAEKRVKKLCDRAKGELDRYCIIFDDMGRNNAAQLLGNILYAMEYRGENVELANGETLCIPANVILIFTECTSITGEKLDYALRRRMDYIRVLKSQQRILEQYYLGVQPRVKQIIIDNYKQIIDFVFDNINDSLKKNVVDYFPGHGLFMVDVTGTSYWILDAFKQKLIYQVAPYMKSLFLNGCLKADSSEMMQAVISSINTGVITLNTISGISKIMANAGTAIVPYSLTDTVNYYNTTIIPAYCSDYKGVLESVIDAIILNGIFSHDLATDTLLTNTNIAAVPSKTTPITYGSYFVKNTEAQDYYYESARAGRSRVSHAYYSTNTPNVGRWVPNKDVAAYEYSYTDGRPNEIFLPLNGMRLHVFTIENVCKADNPAEIYGAVYRLVSYYLKYYESNIAMIMGSEVSYRELDELIKLEQKYLVAVHSNLRNVTPPIAGMTKDKAKMNYFGRKLMNLRTLWNPIGTRVVVDKVRFENLVSGATAFTENEYENLFSGITISKDIELKGVIKMTDLKDYQKIMENIGVRQMIFQGPPGTSKTFETKKFVLKQLKPGASVFSSPSASQEDISNELDAYKLTQEDYDNPAASTKLQTGGWDLVQFHPSYGYEDFIRGIEVATISGMPTYDTVNRILGKIAEFAKIAENNAAGDVPKFYLVIDEINRANLATVFGELIYGLEYRDSKVSTPYEVDDRISSSATTLKTKDIVLGKNLFIIGTMNTADKSIDSIDYAIRRRFLFIDSPADREVVINCYKNVSGNTDDDSIEIFLFDAVQKVFDNEEFFNDEYQKNDIRLGHTYFLRKNPADYLEDIVERFVFQVVPILKEYVKDGVIDSIEDLIANEHSVVDITSAATRDEKVTMASENIMMFTKEFGNMNASGNVLDNQYIGEFIEDLCTALGY